MSSFQLVFKIFLIQFVLLIYAEDFPYYQPTSSEKLRSENKDYWFNLAENMLKKNINYNKGPQISVAKNVIVFIGDGMGISTITSTRIYRGQRLGKSGEEHSLAYETFPNLGLVKTYNVDMQIPDSAGTATAIFTGVKANFKVLGLDVRSNKTNFDSQIYEASKLESIMDWAQAQNKHTGIITTTRITHATPAATYAKVNYREWECDSKIPDSTRQYCKDIARQLIEDNPGKNFKVIMGGGYQQLGYNSKNESTECIRTDGKNLTKSWLDYHKNNTAKFVTNSEQLDQVDPNTTDYLLGLFHADHLPYEVLRDKTPRGTPSLKQMVMKGLRILQKSDGGYVLMVEGGRIDHGHHANYARLALEESAQFDEAIAWVVSQTGPETLILVTADHSHAMTINGYANRGNDILGYGIDNDDDDMKPALTLTYANGPGFNTQYNGFNESVLGPWKDPRNDSTRLMNPKYRHMASFYLDDETHGGEDVAIFAKGPGSELIRGVIEQNYIAHMISYSACIGPRAALNPHCTSSSHSLTPSYIFLSLIFVLLKSNFILS